MIDKEAALELAANYLSQQLLKAARKGEVAVSDQCPRGVYNPTDEPVWTITVPPDTPRVGPSRVLVISRATGAVIFDGFVGE